MLCSAQAGKSASNWLDRLRSNRGIPTGDDDLDLDSFLARISSDSIADHTHSAAKNPSRSSEISAADAHPTLRSVLAELFNFGGSISRSSNLIGKKKCPRKQTNPKFFVASSTPNSITTTIDNDCFARGGKVNDNNNNNNNALVANSFGDVDDAAELKLKEEKNKNMDYCCDIEEEEEEEKDDGGNELRGFSKSEVTVIDTSCPGWKAEKIVFRKNNVWKVRERKGKSKSLAKKKTKGSFGFANHKKEATKGLEYQSGSSSENDKAEFVTPSITTPGQKTQH